MRRLTSPGWPGNLLAVVAGAITTLALAPFDIWPLALVAVGLFYIGLRELSPRQALGRGWCFGFGLFGAGTSWIYYSIHHFGGASVLLAGFLMLLFTAAIAWFFALPAWLWARWLRRNEAPLADALTFAALWVGQEAFRGWFLTGFPWLYSGYSQLDGPLTGLAPLGGMWLISFALTLTAALLCNLPHLLAKDLLPLILKENGDSFNIKDLLRPATFVPESKRLNVLLREFRANHNHMAIVIDEYGGVAGLVTIEDVLEQIVGDIEDEHDVEEDSYIKPLPSGDFLVKALTPIENFNEFFDSEFSDDEFDTVGGLVMSAFGHLPKRNETTEIGAYRFRILNADSRRIHLIRLTPIAR